MLRDIHGHSCCDGCGITGCGVHVVGAELVKARILIVHCPFGWCLSQHLCTPCRASRAAEMTRAWHRENGCESSSKRRRP